jgi:hypothetical protein
LDELFFAWKVFTNPRRAKSKLAKADRIFPSRRFPYEAWIVNPKELNIAAAQGMVVRNLKSLR